MNNSNNINSGRLMLYPPSLQIKNTRVIESLTRFMSPEEIYPTSSII